MTPSLVADLDLSDKLRVIALNKNDLLLPDKQGWDEEGALKYPSYRCEGDEKTVLVSGVKWEEWDVGEKWHFTLTYKIGDVRSEIA